MSFLQCACVYENFERGGKVFWVSLVIHYMSATCLIELREVISSNKSHQGILISFPPNPSGQKLLMFINGRTLKRGENQSNGGGKDPCHC